MTGPGNASSPIPPVVSRRMRIGTVIAVAALAALLLWTPLPIRDAAGLVLFYIVFPAFALAQLPLLDELEFERVPMYVQSAVTILVVGALGIAFGWAPNGWMAPAFAPLPTIELVGWIGGLVAGGLGLIGALSPLDTRAGSRGRATLRRLMPRSDRERRVFAVLSITAGLGEEVAYRGYAIAVIQLLVPGGWTAAALSSVAFGLLHGYQGPIGILRTGLMGFVLAVPVVVTGNLVPSMVAHMLIDIIAGLVLGPRMYPPE